MRGSEPGGLSIYDSAVKRSHVPVALILFVALAACPSSVDIPKRASQITNRAADIEPSVTPLLVELAEKHRGTMIKLEHRLKTRKSTRRKLRKMHNEKPKTPIWRLEIDDSLRYTMQFDDKPAGYHMTAVQRVIFALEQAGHKVVKIKNYWPKGDNYSGVNSVLEHPSGLTWELQFHTGRSLKVQAATREAYEELRDEETPLDRKRQLFDQMTAAWDDVPIPDEILEPELLHPKAEIIKHDRP